jgi:hypothetical protein
MDLNKIRRLSEPFKLGEVRAKPPKKRWVYKDTPKPKGVNGWKAAFTCTVCALSPAGIKARVAGADYLCGPDCLRKIGGGTIRRYDERGKAKPEWTTDNGWGKAGYRPDLQHYLRSMWEANVARWLLWQGIEYNHEPEVFDIDGEGYCPDFWVPKLGVWLEVKGLWNAKSRRKVKGFAATVKDRIVVVDEALYRELRKEYVAAFKRGEVKNLEGWEE